jgi:hypothetical protein
MALPRDADGNPITRAHENKIVEAASDTVRSVVEAIAPDPPDPEYHPRVREFNEVWARTYLALTDLNVVSPATVLEYLDSLPAFPYRWPFLYFELGGIERVPEEPDAGFTGELLCIVGTEQTSHVESQKENFEIFRDVREVLYSDPSLANSKGWGIEPNQLVEPGGVIRSIQWDSSDRPLAFEAATQTDPTFEQIKRSFLIVQYVFQIWYVEEIMIGIRSGND